MTNETSNSRDITHNHARTLPSETSREISSTSCKVATTLLSHGSFDSAKKPTFKLTTSMRRVCSPLSTKQPHHHHHPCCHHSLHYYHHPKHTVIGAKLHKR